MLKGTNQAYQTEINDILLTALAITMNDFTQQKELIIELEGHGREEFGANLNLSRTVGWFTSAFPVKLDLQNCNELGEAIVAVKEQLRSIPQKGIGYGILKYCAGVELPELKRGSAINFNYFGQFGREMENDLLTSANEFAGEILDPFNESVSSISIVSGVYSGRLAVTFVYSKNKYHQKTIEKLLASYMENLGKVINHCYVEANPDE